MGTKVTMEESFYKDRLLQHDIKILLPEEKERKWIHNLIFDELTLGKVLHSSKVKLLSLIELLWDRGAKGVILGCTELNLLISQQETKVPLFDTTSLHAQAAIDLAIQTN